MNSHRIARPDIAEMNGKPALPRRSGELIFHDEWERRVFAIAVKLVANGDFEWRAFQQHLSNAVAEAEGDDPSNPSRGYFESWLVALEAILSETGLMGPNSNDNGARSETYRTQAANCD